MRLKRFKEKYSYQKGVKYGRLTLTGRNYMLPSYGQLRRYVEAECKCGVTKEYLFKRLTEGETKSCGCLRRDVSRKRMTTHGISYHPLSDVWDAMKKRCYDTRNDHYPYYGGKGVKMCKSWKNSFITFYNWCIKNGYEEGKSIDRKDNDGDYRPSNCRFTTRAVQSRNTSRNKMITAFGETKCLFDWGKDKRCVLGVWGLRRRYDSGAWANMEEMISTPHISKKVSQRNTKRNTMITAFGETKCMAAWLEDKRCKVKIWGLMERVKKGWSGEKIISTPPHSSGLKGVILIK